MPDINLLPDELREKEGKEIESVKKKPKVVRIDMSAPIREKIEMPIKTPPQPSILGRLFARKAKLAKLSSTEEKAVPDFQEKASLDKREGEKVLHLPKFKEEKAGLGKPSVLSQLFAQQTKPVEKEAMVVGSKLSQTSDWEKEIEAKIEEKVFHIPQVAADKGKVDQGRKLDLIKEKNKSRFTFKSLIAFLKRFKIIPGKGLKVLSDSTRSMLDVNLIPKELIRYPELEFPKRLFRSGIIVLSSVLLVIIGYLGITLYQLRINQQIKNIEKEIVSINQEVALYDQEKASALAMQKYLEVIRQLLDGHLYWTKFFTFLEKYTIDEIYYTDFSMTGTEKLVISAVGKDYESVAKQLVSFQKASDFIKNVRIDTASAIINYEKGNYEGVNFNIDLEFMPDVFTNKINN